MASNKGNLLGIGKWTEYLFVKILRPQRVVCPRPDAKCMVMVSHALHTSFPLQPLGQLKPNFICSLLAKGELKFL